MTETIRAVHDDDLYDLLESLDLRTKFDTGKLTCAFCKDTISFDNLHSIFAHGGTIKFSCLKPECVTLLISEREGRKHG